MDDVANSEWAMDSFYKIIIEARDDLFKLDFPPKFLELYGEHLYEIVNLHMPNGKVWHVNIERENGKTFLQNGWSKFAKFYSLSDCHLIWFNFIGNSSFNVTIIDMSASEIDYPHLHFTPCNRPYVIPRKNKGKSTDFVNIPSSPSSEEDNKIALQTVTCDRQSIKTKSFWPENIAPTTTSKVIKEVIPVKRYTLPPNIIISTTGRRNKSLDEVMTRVKAHVIAHPVEHPSFATRLPTYNAQYLISIPSKFGRNHMDINKETEEFIIQTKAGKVWKVWTTGMVPHLKLSKGCKEFIIDNKLEVKDICIFQLIHNKQQFKVDILRDAPAKVV